jgi:RNA polymerase sigma-70 factor (ECF subfamily)
MKISSVEKRDKMISNEKLITKLKAKELKALEYLIDNYSNFVFKVSYSVLNNLESSEECTNDVMLKVWDNINSFKGDITQFPKWLVVITKRQAIDMLRKEKKHKNNIVLEDKIMYYSKGVEEEVQEKISVENINKKVQALDRNSREVILRKSFKGETVNDISKELGISVSAVSNRLLRARKKLRLILGGRR